MTLYTDGKTPATDAEIEAEAGRIRKRRQKVERGGRKPKLDALGQRLARALLEQGYSINYVARYFGVAWSTIKRIKEAECWPGVRSMSTLSPRATSAGSCGN